MVLRRVFLIGLGEVPELVAADAEVTLVFGVARVGGGEPLGDGQGGAVVLFGGGAVPGCDREVPPACCG